MGIVHNLKKIIFVGLFNAILLLGFTANSQVPDVPLLPPPIEEASALPKELGGALPKDIGGELPAQKEVPPPTKAAPIELKKPEEKVPEGLKKVEEKKPEPASPAAQAFPDLNSAGNTTEEINKRRNERQMQELQKAMEEQLEIIKKNPELEKAIKEAEKQAAEKTALKPTSEKLEIPAVPATPPVVPVLPPPEPKKEAEAPSSPAARGRDYPIVFTANSVLRISPKPDPAKPELDDLELNFSVTVERGSEVLSDDIIIKDYFVDDDHGALFIYPVKQQASLNLSKLYVPRDVLFIDEFGEILEIIRKAPPRNATPIISKNQVMYVLQLNPGVVKKYAIRVGDKALLISQEDIIR